MKELEKYVNELCEQNEELRESVDNLIDINRRLLRDKRSLAICNYVLCALLLLDAILLIIR